jgi:hypothetical protein
MKLNRSKSINSSNIIIKKDDIVKRNPLYRHLNLIFLQIFSEHKLGPDDIFDKNVWFLYRSSIFKKIDARNNTLQDEPYNEFFKLLKDASLNGENFPNMKINVRAFINEICIQLITAADLKNNSLEKINIYKIYEMKEKINVELFKERINSGYIENMTQLKFSVIQLKNFPEGIYSLELICDSFADSGDQSRINFTKYHSKLNNQRLITVNKMNKDQILSKPEYFKTIILKNEENFDNLNLNECYLSRSKFYDEECYIGILINSFKFVIDKDYFSFALSDSINFLYLFLNNLDSLINNKPFKISCSTFAYLINDEKDKKFEIDYVLEIDFNKKIKILILEKIYNLFQDIIITGYENDKLIHNYLEYFIEYREEIRSIINEINNTSNTCVCDGCVMF